VDELRVYIITEGSSSIGFGHVTRCLSLYQAFEERGVKPKFIVNGDKSILRLLIGTNCEIVNWFKKQQMIFEKVKDADIVVVDSYLAGTNFYESLSKLVRLAVYIDDNKRIDYPEGIVVNGNIHAKDLNYPEKERVIYLLGTEYTPLRKEFWEVPEKEIRKTVQSAMITFGGDDIRNMTPKVLKLLSKNHPELKKNVIIGKGFRNVDEIKNSADENTNLIYYPNAEEIKEVMLDSDIAISAGGQTLYELARVGVPTIAIAVADNQMGNVKGWQKTGFIEYAGWWEDEDVIDNVEIAFRNIIYVEERKRRKELARKYIDGKGCLRIIDFLLVFLREA